LLFVAGLDFHGSSRRTQVHAHTILGGRQHDFMFRPAPEVQLSAALSADHFRNQATAGPVQLQANDGIVLVEDTDSAPDRSAAIPHFDVRGM